jgi:hypothetical protein
MGAVYEDDQTEELVNVLRQLVDLLDRILAIPGLIDEHDREDLDVALADARDRLPRAERTVRELAERDALGPVGLTGAVGRAKLSVWQRLVDRWDDMRLSGPSDMLRGILAKLLKLGNSFLGSLEAAGGMAGIGGVFEPIKEIKELFEVATTSERA